jgi:hypothetical protein
MRALKTDVILFSETLQKPHMRFYIQNNDSYLTDREDWHKGRTDLLVKKYVRHTCVDLLPLLSVEETGICSQLETLKCCLHLFVNLQKTVK